MSNNFRYQLFVEVSANLRREVPVVDNVLSSHEQKIYPSIDSMKTAEFNFQRDWSNYVDLRPMSSAVKLKLVTEFLLKRKVKKGIKRYQKKLKWTKKCDEILQLLWFLISKNLSFVLQYFSNGDVYINNQQIFNFN